MELFQTDNFSQSDIKYKEIDFSLVVLHKILDNYFDNYKIKKVFKLDRSEINSENYQVIIEIGELEKIVLLRQHKALRESEQIIFYLDLLTKLYEKGVKVSQVLKTKNNQLSIIIDGCIYSLFEFIEANHFEPKQDSLKSVAKAIAEMHVALNQFDDSLTSRIGLLSESGYAYFHCIKQYNIADFRKIEEIIKQKGRLNEQDRIILKKMPIFINAASETKKHDQEIEKITKQIIHSDLHPYNILMKDNQVKAIVDFDSLRLSQQARDAAFAIYRFGRQFFVQNRCLDIKKEAVQLSDEFLEEYIKIRPLSDKEVKLLPILVKDDFLRKLLFVLRGVYQEGNNTWSHDLPKIIMAFEEIDYFWP